MAEFIDEKRRSLSMALLATIAVPGEGIDAAEHEQGALVQLETASDANFIARAFELRQRALDSGDQGYGALVVREGRIIGQSESRVIIDGDPTAHAEMEAIRDAARRSETRDLGGCTLYSSSPPCPMCEAAAFWANIDRMIHGAGAIQSRKPRLCR